MDSSVIVPWNRDEVFDLGRTRAGESDEDICQRHVNLGFFLTRRDRAREEAHQQRRDGEQRRQRIVLEAPRQAARDSEFLSHRSARSGP